MTLGIGALGLAVTSIGAALPIITPIAGIIAGIGASIALLKFSGVAEESLTFFSALHDGFAGL